MNEKIESYYKNLYTSKQDEFNANGHKFAHLYNGRVKLVSDMARMIEAKNIVALDAGCGNGMFFEDALSKNLSISSKDGIDLLEDAVNLAREKYDKIACGSTVELSKYFDAKYDFVNSMEIFSYIKPEDRQQFFAEHANILNNDGYFLLTVTNLHSIYRKIIKPEAELFPYYFDKNTILELYKNQKNLELIACKGVDIFNIIHKCGVADFFLYELSFLFRKKAI